MMMMMMFRELRSRVAVVLGTSACFGHVEE